jgi:hypothetical protein
MGNMIKSLFYKLLVVFLCLFLAFEVHYISAFQTTEELTDLFNSAKEAYFRTDYQTSKGNLEFLKGTLSRKKGMDSLKGEVYLLLGATYEKLKYKNFAIKFYCMAKSILGEGETIEGLDLETLTLYKTLCETKTGESVSYLIVQFEKGLNAYNAGKYKRAQSLLEGQIPAVKNLSNLDSLKGETYLLLGAACEQLKDKKLALKYYDLAKEILGEVDSIEGIQLSNLRWYKGESAIWAAEEGEEKKKRGIGGLLGLILSAGIIIGLVVYLLTLKKEPPGPKNEPPAENLPPVLLDLQGPAEVEPDSTHTYRAKGYDPDGESVYFLIRFEYDITHGSGYTFERTRTGVVSNYEWASFEITWKDAKSGGRGLVSANVYEADAKGGYPKRGESLELVIKFK